jgi:hypothetical protein
MGKILCSQDFFAVRAELHSAGRTLDRREIGGAVYHRNVSSEGIGVTVAESGETLVEAALMASTAPLCSRSGSHPRTFWNLCQASSR